MSALQGLADLVGEWRGTNTYIFPAPGKPEQSPSNLTVTPMLGGSFIRLDYTWDYQGAPQEGSRLLGYDAETALVSGQWIDTWHMGKKVMACQGSTPDGGILSIRGSYAAPPGPDWGWRIEIADEYGQSIRIAHFNIHPDGKEEPAVVAQYSRV
jgi:hypothetical protein